jgi:hypothetical protein
MGRFSANSVLQDGIFRPVAGDSIRHALHPAGADVSEREHTGSTTCVVQQVQARAGRGGGGEYMYRFSALPFKISDLKVATNDDR